MDKYKKPIWKLELASYRTRGRTTNQKLSIMRIIVDIDGPFTPNDVWEIARKDEKIKISRASVYNVIDFFVKTDLVSVTPRIFNLTIPE